MVLNFVKNMALKIVFFLSVLFSVYNCTSIPQSSQAEKHIYYLHGRIVEQQGKNAISEQYGKYEFDSIVASLYMEGHILHSPIRSEDVDVTAYAIKISKEVDSLVNNGVLPIDISIVGASKGAIIAANISDRNQHSINYVLLAGNNEYQEQNNDWKFHGYVLCIYEKSDSIAGRNYNYWKSKENFTVQFKQLEIETDLGHGFLYRPLDAWVKPTLNWIQNQEK